MDRFPIDGPSTGRPEPIAAWAKRRGAKRPEDVSDYLHNLYSLCVRHGLSFDVLVAQSIHETSSVLTGAPWASHWWEARLNPAGIGITGDEDQNQASKTFANGAEAAKAHFVHMWGYTRGQDLPPSLSPEDSPRWNALKASGMMGSIQAVGDLGGGYWASDASYAAGIIRHMEALKKEGLLSFQPTKEESGMKLRDKPVVLAIGMGHRNLDKGGASGEYDWTPGAARALQRRARARGMIAELIQESDGDSEPNFSNYHRQKAAERGLAAIKKEHGRIDVIVFMHYNGGGAAGAHFIHVDGWSAPQRKGDNGSDVRMIREIAKAVGETKTVGLLRPTWAGISDPQAGVMSERQSGAVNNTRGWRLGEMLAGDPYQREARRVIAEAGSIDVAKERAYIRDERWVEFTYCEAMLNGIESELGVYRDGGDPTPGPDPEPTPTPTYPSPVRLPELDNFRDFPEERTPAYVKTANEGSFFLIGRDVTVTNENGTPRMMMADEADNRRVGPDLEPGDTFYAWFGGVNDAGRPYVYTLWATRIWLDDTNFGVISNE